MDKCREEFEKQRYWIRLFRTGVDFDPTIGEFGRYIANGSKITDAMDLYSFNEKWESWANSWQHQQAKVEELQKRIDIMQEKINEVVDYIGDDFDDFYLGETNSDIHKILTADLEQALKEEV